jgi:DNA-binding transcriptional ArsR family regulator
MMTQPVRESERAAQAEIDPRIRPIAFGLVELLFDLTFFIRELYGDDLDCAQIMICVNDATMRPFMDKLSADSEVLRMRAPPEEIRGSISRRMIAEKTGIARETVRRKVAMLIEAGVLVADEEDGVRAVPKLDDPQTSKILEAGHAAVKRYLELVGGYGVD